MLDRMSPSLPAAFAPVRDPSDVEDGETAVNVELKLRLSHEPKTLN